MGLEYLCVIADSIKDRGLRLPFARMEEKQEYASFNVLSRKPLVGGVPIMILVGFSFAMLGSAVLGFIFLPTKIAFIIPAILLFGLVVIKFMCEEKSNAMDDLQWTIKGALMRLQQQSIIFSVSPHANSENMRKEKIHEFFKKYKR